MSTNKTKKRPKKYVIELTLKSVVFWVVGSAFIFVWVFLLGVFVGGGHMSFSKIKEKFAWIEDKYGVKLTSQPDAMPKPAEYPPFEFFDELEAKKKDAAKNSQPSVETKVENEIAQYSSGLVPSEAKTDIQGQPADAAQQSPQVQPIPEEGHDSGGHSIEEPSKIPEEKSLAASQPVPEKKPIEAPAIAKKEPATKPAPQSKPVSGNGHVETALNKIREKTLEKEKNIQKETIKYVLQLGGFNDRAKAASLAKRLTGKGYSASLANTTRGGRPFYRVKCGPFETETMADDFKRTLAKKEGIYGVVTRAGN